MRARAGIHSAAGRPAHHCRFAHDLPEQLDSETGIPAIHGFKNMDLVTSEIILRNALFCVTFGDK